MRLAGWVDHWPAFVVAAIVLALIASWIHRRRSTPRPPSAADQMERDAQDAARRWIQAAFSIVSGTSDYGYLSRSEAHRMLVRWWQIHGPRDHARILDELEDAGRRPNAWDLVRIMVVTRLGVAAGYLDHEQSWAMLQEPAQRLQTTYSDWASVGAAYLAARRQWKGQAPDGSEDDRVMVGISQNIAHLRETTWPAVPFDSPLFGNDE